MKVKIGVEIDVPELGSAFKEARTSINWREMSAEAIAEKINVRNRQGLYNIENEAYAVPVGKVLGFAAVFSSAGVELPAEVLEQIEALSQVVQSLQQLAEMNQNFEIAIVED